MKTFLITAGPTIEPIDPVRYISNYSTGEMGYALAVAAKKRGNKVVLISGPTALKPPKGIKFIPVKTAFEMRRAVLRHFRGADCVIMTAAVADFRPADFSGEKLKKGTKKEYFLRLLRNPDILSELGKRKGSKVLVGYSLETDNHMENTRSKMKSKNLDLIVANKAGKLSSPFGKGKKDLTIISRKSGRTAFKAVSKEKISHILLDKIEVLW
ncbi:MAG: phosphopantothenoylcysteine decarboxylase [Candidatus Omnitrophica bacterium]|nr:phosphopantothenoylcysteine decarboxylase [Candidatus Omnitrophota bacterium]MBU4488064.1 phosphopantothenoylcysteine decarboxylase [Candidatus Omnitrophota bacterium]